MNLVEIRKCKDKGRCVSKRRVLVTDRDIEIVRWLGRHRLATADQVMRRFGLQRSKAYLRLSVLVDNDLVRHETGIRSARVYLATKLGLAAAGLDMPGGTVSASSFAHDLAVIDVAIPIEQTPGLRVLTERELRRSGSIDTNRFKLRSLGFGEGARGYWPDLVMIDPARQTTTAVEVELTLKKAARIQRKIRAYAMSQYDHVRYICTNRGIAIAVRREVARFGLKDTVAIETLKSAKSTNPACAESVVSDLQFELDAERRQSAAAKQAIKAAEAKAESAHQATIHVIDEIAEYLRADRPVQRQIRDRWNILVVRADDLRRTQDNQQ